jgi:hypothetical protein
LRGTLQGRILPNISLRRENQQRAQVSKYRRLKNRSCHFTVGAWRLAPDSIARLFIGAIFLALRRLRCLVDHQPQRADDEISCWPLDHHSSPRDHFMGTLSTLVSCSFSYLSSAAHAGWCMALSAPEESTLINEFSVARSSPLAPNINQGDKDDDANSNRSAQRRCRH